MIYALYKYTIYIQIMYFFFYFVIKIIAQCTNAYSPLFFNAIHIHLLLLFGWKMTRSWQVLSESTLKMSLPWWNRHVFLFSSWEIYILKACVSSEDKEDAPAWCIRNWFSYSSGNTLIGRFLHRESACVRKGTAVIEVQ